MSWSDPIHVQFADRAAAIAFGRSLGIEIPEAGAIPSGTHHFALEEVDPPLTVPPVSDADGNLVTPGTRAAGCWLMGRLNMDWPGAAAALAAIEAAGIRRTRDDVTWA